MARKYVFSNRKIWAMSISPAALRQSMAKSVFSGTGNVYKFRKEINSLGKFKEISSINVKSRVRTRTHGSVRGRRT
jgi:hypothetical protein